MQPTLSPMPHMQFQPELVVDSFYRRTIMTVECIASADESAEKAVYLRDTLLPEEIEIDDCFFMLARISVINLWMPGRARGALPDYTASVLPILRQTAGDIRDLDRPRLREAMAHWLRSVSQGRPPAESEVERMLVASGLYAKLRGGYVRVCGL
jgi:hypothetical protein